MNHEQFSLSGDVDIATAKGMGGGLLEFAIRSNGWPVVVDCSALNFIDSSGLNMLVFVKNCTGKEIELRRVPPQMRQVLELTALDKVFHLTEVELEQRAGSR